LRIAVFWGRAILGFIAPALARRVGVLAPLLFAAIVGLLSHSASADDENAAKGAKRPNFVIVLADDK
jgi:hypothetical protein